MECVNSLLEGKESEIYHLFEELGDIVLTRVQVPKLMWRFMGLAQHQVAHIVDPCRNRIRDVLKAKIASSVVKPEKEMDVLDRLLSKTTVEGGDVSVTCYRFLKGYNVECTS